MQEANPASYRHKFFEKFARRHLLPISFFLLLQNLKTYDYWSPALIDVTYILTRPKGIS